MARIISGSFKGRRLFSVPGDRTRPTSDRVKESLFSLLEGLNAIDDAVVLDLFAGSGGLGLEALSRGARSVEFVDKAEAAYRVLRRNAEPFAAESAGPATDFLDTAPDSARSTTDSTANTVQASAKVVVSRADALAYLRQRQGPPVELVFLDPPYEMAQNDLGRILNTLYPQLHPAATVVVERDQHSAEPPWPERMASFREKSYGSTRIWFGEVAEPEYA